jgi:hypothetical protein
MSDTSSIYAKPQFEMTVELDDFFPFSIRQMGSDLNRKIALVSVSFSDAGLGVPFVFIDLYISSGTKLNS